MFQMRKASAQIIAMILRREIFTRSGVPDFILCDRGTQFVLSIFRELCSKWNTVWKLPTAYHPQTNMTGRVNRTIKYMIASYVEENHKKWDQYVPEFRFAVNSAIQESIGLSPAELQLGQKLPGPGDKLHQLQENSLLPSDPSYDVLNHTAQVRNYNNNRREVIFREKDHVWLRNFPQSSARQSLGAKLAPEWKGLHRVIKQREPLNYQIALDSTGEDVRTTHVCNPKPCYPTANDLELHGKQRLQEIFQESSDEDTEFQGF